MTSLSISINWKLCKCNLHLVTISQNTLNVLGLFSYWKNAFFIIFITIYSIFFSIAFRWLSFQKIAFKRGSVVRQRQHRWLLNSWNSLTWSGVGLCSALLLTAAAYWLTFDDWAAAKGFVSARWNGNRWGTIRAFTLVSKIPEKSSITHGKVARFDAIEVATGSWKIGFSANSCQISNTVQCFFYELAASRIVRQWRKIPP